MGYHIGFLNNSTVCSTEGSRNVHLWNVEDGQIQDTIELDEGPWNTIRIGTDCERQRLAILRCNWPTKPEVKSELLIWDGQSESLEAKRYTVPEAAGTVIPFSASGRFIGVPGQGHTTIVDLVEGRTRTIEFSSWVKSCDFSHDETMIACAPTDGPVRFFDLMTLEEVRSPVEMDHTSTGCIKFAPNSNVLGSTGFDRRFRLYDLDENREVLAGEQCPRYLSTLSFSPDGRRVATGSMDGRVRIFSTLTGDEMFSVDVMPWYAYVQFSPDGESLAIASGSENLVVHAPNQQWVSSLSRTKLDEIVCRDVTFCEMKYHNHERKGRE